MDPLQVKTPYLLKAQRGLYSGKLCINCTGSGPFFRKRLDNSSGPDYIISNRKTVTNSGVLPMPSITFGNALQHYFTDRFRRHSAVRKKHINNLKNSSDADFVLGKQ